VQPALEAVVGLEIVVAPLEQLSVQISVEISVETSVKTSVETSAKILVAIPETSVETVMKIPHGEPGFLGRVVARADCTGAPGLPSPQLPQKTCPQTNPQLLQARPQTRRQRSRK
jgi:hypothetical protein